MTDACNSYRLKTQYRHKYFSVVSDNTLGKNKDIGVGLNTVATSPCGCLAVGVSSSMNVMKGEEKKKYDYLLTTLSGRLSLIRGPWTVFLESSNFGRNYCLSLARKVLLPHFANQMVIAARVTAHAARPDLANAKTVKEKAAEINRALAPKATIAVRTSLTDSSSAKIKVDSKGLVGFSFAEQLSQWAHAVFAVNVDATQLSKINTHSLAFTLTLLH